MADTLNTALCDEKHKNIEARLEAHDQHFIKNDEEHSQLKESAIRSEVLVSQLCKKIDLLVGVFISIFITMLGATMGFIIWYIQQPK